MKLTLKWTGKSGDGKCAFVEADQNDGWKDLRIEVDTDDCDGKYAREAMQYVIDTVNAAAKGERMSTTINDGGPAFPHHETTSTGEPFHDHLGMTLRDWFAGQALAGWLASFGDDAQHPIDKGGEVIATQAYKTADAMLAARSKGGAA